MATTKTASLTKTAAPSKSLLAAQHAIDAWETALAEAARVNEAGTVAESNAAHDEAGVARWAAFDAIQASGLVGVSHRGSTYIAAKGEDIYGMPGGWGGFETIIRLPGSHAASH